jgi:hypothetical protein
MHDEKPVKLAAKLPKKDNLNGLDTVHEQLRRHGTAIIIAQVTAPTVTERLGGIREPRAEIESIEGLPADGGGDSLNALGARLLELARAERLGDDGVMFGRRDILIAIRDHLTDVINRAESRPVRDADQAD